MSVPEAKLEAFLNAERAAGHWPTVLYYEVAEDGSLIAIVEVKE